MKSDFEYLTGLVDDFFAKSHIQKSLQLIHDQEITGWETWWQIEFSRFLYEHITEPEWDREITLEYDYRMEKERWCLRPDFIIRKKGWRRDSYVALELKQNPKLGACLNNMMADVQKLYKLRQSEIDLRNFWVLGISERKPKAEMMERIYNKLEEWEVESESVHVRYVPNVKAFSYFLF